MRANDFIKITAYGAKRNWKSHVAMTIAMTCLLVVSLFVALFGYNCLKNFDFGIEQFYKSNGAQLSISINEAEDFDKILSVAKDVVGNGTNKVEKGELDYPYYWMMGGGSYVIGAILFLNQPQVEEGKILLSQEGKRKAEGKLGRELVIGEILTFSIFGFDDGEIEIAYAGVSDTTIVNIKTIAKVVNNMLQIQHLSIKFDYGNEQPYKSIQSDLDSRVKEINGQLGKDAASSNVSDNSNREKVLLISFVVILIAIIAMVGISAIGSHIAMQTAKDSYFFNIMRAVGLSKGKLAAIEFIQMLAVLMVATIVASVLILPMGGIIAKVSMLYLKGATLPFRFPAWISLACFGFYTAILALFAPGFVRKFDSKSMLLGLREKE